MIPIDRRPFTWPLCATHHATFTPDVCWSRHRQQLMLLGCCSGSRYCAVAHEGTTDRACCRICNRDTHHHLA